MAKLQHPNILQVYDTGEHAGLKYVAEEWVEGVPLRQRINGHPFLPRRQLYGLLESLAGTVQFLHGQDIIHCALAAHGGAADAARRPQDRRLRVGQGARADRPQRRSRGCSWGWRWCTAPEQLAGRTGEVSRTADVYALGMILYEMLTGRLPFPADSLDALTRHVLSVALHQPPSHWQRGVSPTLDQICLKCLEKGPKALRQRQGRGGGAAAVPRLGVGGDLHPQHVESAPGLGQAPPGVRHRGLTSPRAPARAACVP